VKVKTDARSKAWVRHFSCPLPYRYDS
jgi:hypothetical protein